MSSRMKQYCYSDENSRAEHETSLRLYTPLLFLHSHEWDKTEILNQEWYREVKEDLQDSRSSISFHRVFSRGSRVVLALLMRLSRENVASSSRFWEKDSFMLFTECENISGLHLLPDILEGVHGEHPPLHFLSDNSWESHPYFYDSLGNDIIQPVPYLSANEPK